MAEFLGARISLISKSDIRYSGTLHEINSEESTVALENVRSFGTEGRKGKPEDELPASEQVYEYIVFRGSDVKDLRIEQGPAAPQEEKPPAIPNDPAIVGARPRPTQAAAPPFLPGPPGPGFGPNMHMPPPPPNWGPPGPGSPHRGFPYQPPPGWFPPHGFPPGPGGPGPGPWGNQFYPPGVPTPPGAPGAPGGPGFPQQHQIRQQPPQTPENRQAPIGAGTDKQRQLLPSELASESKSLGQAGPSHAQAHTQPAKAPVPPVESKPSVEEVKATAAALAANGPGPSAGKAQANIPTGPRVAKITPVVPLPTALTNKTPQLSTSTGKRPNEQSAAVSQAAIKDATDAARAAVTAAMAKLDPTAGGPSQVRHTNGSNAMDNLTRKVNEMRVNAARTGTHATRGGRGRGSGLRPVKVEVPDADFDFATSNAKFNKEDIVKEAIAGSPLGETPASHDETHEASDAVPPPAYSKTRSFFDNISSEAKERAENGGQKPGGREWRGVEQRKNMETFGQGSVDGGGYRGYRGGGRGRGRGRGGRGGRGGYRPRNDGQNTTVQQQ